MKANKLLVLAMAGIAVGTLAACGPKQPGRVDHTTDKVAPVLPTSYEYIPLEGIEDEYDLESSKIYNEVFGQFAHTYEAVGGAKSISERYALQAIAEAKLLETGAFLPGEGSGGNRAMSRIAPRTAPGALWGTDEYRVGTLLIAETPITAADRQALRELWVEKQGTGTYLAEAKQYLQEHGYTLKRTYNRAYSGDPKSWDVLSDYYAATAEPLVLTYDGLVQYDAEDQIVPALAESWEQKVVNGKVTYEFTIRSGAKWTKNDGTEIAPVTAEDFVTGFQHMLDAGVHSWYMDGIIEGVADYEGDMSVVGVKAEGNKVIYTFEEGADDASAYFMSMLGYSPMAPLCKTFYLSEGGHLGNFEKVEGVTRNGNYAKDYTHIAYCGAYRISAFTAASSITFTKNPEYWNVEALNIDTITWTHNDGKDPEKLYNDFKNGDVDSVGLNVVTMPKAKAEGLFDTLSYVSGVDAGSYPFWFSGNRKAFDNGEMESVYPLPSVKTSAEQEKAQKALANQNFRLALATGIDRHAFYLAQTGDEDTCMGAAMNSYTPATFVHLPEAVTVEINGVETTFEKGASYGEVLQAQLDADGMPVTAWRADPTADDGRGTGSGFDGWYSIEWSLAFLNKAVEELAAQGVTVSKSQPVVLEYPYVKTSEQELGMATAVKRSIEDATNGLVQVKLQEAENVYGLYFAAYYNETGAELNVDISKISGWGPDYGDPKTYLDTFLPTYDGMVKNFGIF